MDNIPPGANFKKILDEKVGECSVLLTIIGDKSLGTKAGGKRRLEDPADYVRIEIESALARDIPVIPVLVGKAPMPSEWQLPDGLKEFAYRNAVYIP